PSPVPDARPVSRRSSTASSHHSDGTVSLGQEAGEKTVGAVQGPPVAPQPTPSGHRWRALAQGLPFRRVRRNDEERGVTEEKPQVNVAGGREVGNGWDIRSRLEEFAMTQAERLRERVRPTPDTDSLPVTVIPAPPRRGAALAQL